MEAVHWKTVTAALAVVSAAHLGGCGAGTSGHSDNAGNASGGAAGVAGAGPNGVTSARGGVGGRTTSGSAGTPSGGRAGAPNDRGGAGPGTGGSAETTGGAAPDSGGDGPTAGGAGPSAGGDGGTGGTTSEGGTEAGGSPEAGAGGAEAGAGGEGGAGGAESDPCAALEATPADFGVLICEMYWPITLYNPTEDLIAITTPTLSGSIFFYGGTYPGNEGTCGPTLTPGETCLLDILIDPGIPFGTQSVDLSIEYSRNCGMRTLVVPFRGEFQREAKLSFEESLVDFGATSDESTVSITVMNEGDRGATDVNPVTFTNDAFDFTGGTYPGTTEEGACTDILEAGDECTMSITFAPEAAAGDVDATLRFGYDSGCYLSEVELPLSGEGL